MSAYDKYFEQYILSTESRDMEFSEWLCFRLDKQVKNACEWLEKNYGQFDGKVEDFVADFKKAMELC